MQPPGATDGMPGAALRRLRQAGRSGHVAEGTEKDETKTVAAKNAGKASLPRNGQTERPVRSSGQASPSPATAPPRRLVCAPGAMAFSLYRGRGLDRPEELTTAIAMRDFWTNVVGPVAGILVIENGELPGGSGKAVALAVNRGSESRRTSSTIPGLRRTTVILCRRA